MSEDQLTINRVELRQHMNVLSTMADDWDLAAEAAAKVIESVSRTKQSPDVDRMRRRARACRFAARLISKSLEKSR